MQVGQYSITWMHPSHFESACEMNKQAGFINRDIGWLKHLYQQPNVFSMASFSSAGLLMGWATYRKTTSGIELLWMIVPEEYSGNGIGTAMIDRMKVWLEAVPGRRGTLACNVHQYCDDMLYFLRKHEFVCLKINPVSESYRMLFIR